MQKEKSSRKMIMIMRVLFSIAFAASIVFIYWNSAQNGEVSGNMSKDVLLLSKAALRKGGFVAVSQLLTEHMIRKLAHFLEYVLFGALGLSCIRWYFGSIKRHIGSLLFFAQTVALTDETSQMISAGRAAQVTDVWIDFSGAIFGIMAASLFWLLLSILFKRSETEKS